MTVNKSKVRSKAQWDKWRSKGAVEGYGAALLRSGAAHFELGLLDAKVSERRGLVSKELKVNSGILLRRERTFERNFLSEPRKTKLSFKLVRASPFLVKFVGDLKLRAKTFPQERLVEKYEDDLAWAVFIKAFFLESKSVKY